MRFCAYCGRDDRITNDHVPPKGIFAKPRPSDLITVPACEQCHGSTSADDEYFRIRLGLSDKARNQQSIASCHVSIFKALNRPEAEGLKRQLLQDTVSVEVNTPSGIYVGQRLAMNVDLTRIFRVVERTVRGLYFHETGGRLADGAEVLVHSDDTLSSHPPDVLEMLDNTIIKPLFHVRPKVIGPGTFSYRYALTDMEFASVWALTFYGEIPFLAMSLPEHGIPVHVEPKHS